MSTIQLGHPWTCLLPCALEGEYNLLLIEYTPRQQQQIAVWLTFAMRLAAEYATFRYYVLSVHHHGSHAVNGSAIPDDKSAKAMHLFLVQQTGVILWQEQGDWSPAKAEALDDFLLALMPLRDTFG